MSGETADLGFARLDLSRPRRTGAAETVYCPGKTCAQLVAILRAFAKAGQSVLATRCAPEQAEAVAEAGLGAAYDATGRVLTLGPPAPPTLGTAIVLTGGTADLPVAEEAAQTAAFLGAAVTRCYDVGVAGLHRLLGRLDDVRAADVVIAVAGMEGALGSVVAGLVEAPVIAVPTSVGYGASFQGLAPLLSMLNACAEGLAVVNIDNGFGAGVMACRILRLAQRKRPHA